MRKAGSIIMPSNTRGAAHVAQRAGTWPGILIFIISTSVAAANSLDNITLQVMELDQSPEEFAHIISIPTDSLQTNTETKSPTGLIQADGTSSAALNRDNAIIPDTLLLKDAPLSIGEPGLWQDRMAPALQSPPQLTSPDYSSIERAPAQPVTRAIRNATIPRPPQPPGLDSKHPIPVAPPLR